MRGDSMAVVTSVRFTGGGWDPVKVTLEMSDGVVKENFFDYFDDEFNYSESEFIGKTLEEVNNLIQNKIDAYFGV